MLSKPVGQITRRLIINTARTENDQRFDGMKCCVLKNQPLALPDSNSERYSDTYSHRVEWEGQFGAQLNVSLSNLSMTGVQVGVGTACGLKWEEVMM